MTHSGTHGVSAYPNPNPDRELPAATHSGPHNRARVTVTGTATPTLTVTPTLALILIPTLTPQRGFERGGLRRQAWLPPAGRPAGPSPPLRAGASLTTPTVPVSLPLSKPLGGPCLTPLRAGTSPHPLSPIPTALPTPLYLSLSPPCRPLSHRHPIVQVLLSSPNNICILINSN